MEKFFPDNYRQTMRDIRQIILMLEDVRLDTNFRNHDMVTSDTLLLAAIEIWKHQNPWIGKEYGEEEF